MDLRNSVFLSVVVLVCLLSACSPLNEGLNSSNEPLSRHGNPPYYSVAGIRYIPLKDSVGYVEEGDASWYGEEFHGRRTANGELFDRYGFSAAHKTLPLPSIVEVTNLENQRRLIVRVNDRGPFHGDRLIDLSYAAAKKLGFAAKGIAKVRVSAIPMKRNTQDTYTYIQVAAFRQLSMAEQIKTQMSQDELSLPISIVSTKDWHRVQVGPLKNINEINLAVDKLKKTGLSGWFFVSNQ